MRLLPIILLISFSANATNIVNIKNDTTVNGIWNLQGSILNLSAKISGKCIIRNALLQANSFIQIFDTSVVLENCRVREFSAMWFGAKQGIVDNAYFIQHGIDQCIANDIRDYFIPGGKYKFSKGLKVIKWNTQAVDYTHVTINIYGESDIWNDYTELIFENTSGYGIGVQQVKGGSIHNLRLTGQFKSPVKSGISYYNIASSDYNDISGKNCAKYNSYAGLLIDYNRNYTSSKSGSSGYKVYDIFIGNFDMLVGVSVNGVTDNADVIIFDNIQLGDARIGFAGGQAQEKGNIIRNIVAWGSIHTLISLGIFGKSQTGGYTIDGGNIAGAVVQLFDIHQKGWFGSHVSNLYAESIGRLGNVFSGDQFMKTPTTFTNCNFDFELKSASGTQNILQSNNNNTVFTSCRFRYYGTYNDTLNLSNAKATFINCDIPNPIRKHAEAVYYSYPIPALQQVKTPTIRIIKSN